MTENFGSTPEDFDFDAWLEQGGRPRRTVKVYRDWHLMDELKKLEALIEVAEQDDDPSMDDVGADELREQREELLEQLAKSAMEVTLQAVTDEEAKTLAAGIPEVEHKYRDAQGVEKTRWQPDRDAFSVAMVAAATVSPKLSRDQVRAMRAKLGDGPTLVLFETAGELRMEGTEFPSVPFSPGHSDDSQK